MSSRGKKKITQRILAAIDKASDTELNKMIRRMNPEEYVGIMEMSRKYQPELTIKIDRCTVAQSNIVEV